MIAITREISPLIGNCELTHLERQIIDLTKAMEQHRIYEQFLERIGCTLHRLPAAPDLPDGVFVEDTAVIFPEAGIITRPGAESRRPETVSMASELKKWRPIRIIEAPGTLDGGDVLTIGKRVWIGISGRSNREGFHQFKNHLKPFGYTIEAVKFTGCLHLKTALAPIDRGLMLINPIWVDPGNFGGITCIPVHPEEPYGANVIRLGDSALCSTDHPHTIALVERTGLNTHAIDYSELAKAEAGLTCCSVIFPEISGREQP
jgi:dimethylargininase